MKKPVDFDVYFKEKQKGRAVHHPPVFTNDQNTVEINLHVKDIDEAALENVTPKILLYMKDGSFYPIKEELINRNGSTYSYTLRDNQGKHSGQVQVQLLLISGETNPASPLYRFRIDAGLDTVVATEVMLDDWDSLTKQAQDYINDFVANEAERQSGEDDRISNEQARQDIFNQMIEDGVYQSNIEQKLTELEAEYAQKLTSVTAQLAQTQQQFTDAVANVTVDSEVILARGTYGTLGERLDVWESVLVEEGQEWEVDA